MDSLLVSLSSHDSSTNIQNDVNVLSNIADTFINLDSDDLLIRHFGIELKNYNERLQEKITNARDAIATLKTKFPNEHILNNILNSFNTEINTNRSESKLLDSPSGFVNISSKDLHERINISSMNVSPVILLWEKCLNKHNGKVNSALKEFTSTLEKTPTEFSSHISEISADLKHVKLAHSQKILQTLGQYNQKLREFDTEILKNAEISIALASYVLGEQNTYTSPLITNHIQKKHKNYLLSFS